MPKTKKELLASQPTMHAPGKNKYKSKNDDVGRYSFQRNFQKKTMGRKGKRRPCFLRILCTMDFTELLRLPVEFTREYGSTLPKKVKLRLMGREWKVKVEALRGEKKGMFGFTSGWSTFCTEVGLEFGELLVFTLGDGGLIDVSVFESNGCRKDFSDDEDDDDSEEDDEDDDGPRTDLRQQRRNSLSYEFVLKPHHKYRLTLRSILVKAAGFTGNTSVKVVGEHCEKNVELDNNHSNANRFDLGTGWSDFRIANRLVYGKTYSVEFNHNTNFILIKEVQGNQLVLFSL